MIWVFYRIDNKVNGKYYLGIHGTNNINDSYMGSGVLIREAIRKYGRDSFTKTILKTFDSEVEARKYEAEQITEEVLKDSNNYNVAEGGGGGSRNSKHYYIPGGKHYIVNENAIEKFLVEHPEAIQGKPKECLQEYVKGTRQLPLAKAVPFIVHSTRFIHLLEFFNYSVSSVTEQGAIIVEPVYTTSGKDFIVRNCHSVVYRICPKVSVDQILKQGLRCRTGSDEKGGKYRDFPKRIYVLAFDPKEGNIRGKLRDFIQNTFRSNTDKFSALRCKVNGNDFYRDTTMPNISAYFTYSTIPPEHIELFNL